MTKNEIVAYEKGGTKGKATSRPKGRGPGRPPGSRQVDRVALLILDTANFDDRTALDIHQMAALLHCAPSTIDAIMKSDHPIPMIRLGQRRRWLWGRVKGWLQERIERDTPHPKLRLSADEAA